MVEPLACCLRGVDRAGIEAGAAVAILGAGPIGLMLAACVADAGGWPVLVGGRAGAARAWQSRSVRRPATGAGADIVIEAVGTEAGMVGCAAARATGWHGRAVRRAAARRAAAARRVPRCTTTS